MLKKGEDFSFWIAQKDCIEDPNELWQSPDADVISNRSLYPFTRKCIAYPKYQDKSKEVKDKQTVCGHFQSIQSLIGKSETIDICPNSRKSESECLENQYFCNRSKSCIGRDKTCDGIANCLYGEDESFEICQHIFPKSAAIICSENKDREDPYQYKA